MKRAEGVRLVHPGEELALWGPHCGLPVLKEVLMKMLTKKMADFLHGLMMIKG